MVAKGWPFWILRLLLFREIMPHTFPSLELRPSLYNVKWHSIDNWKFLFHIYAINILTTAVVFMRKLSCTCGQITMIHQQTTICHEIDHRVSAIFIPEQTNWSTQLKFLFASILRNNHIFLCLHTHIHTHVYIYNVTILRLQLNQCG